MAGTIDTLDATERHFLLGESLRPLLSVDTGSSIEIFDTGRMGGDHGTTVAE